MVRLTRRRLLAAGAAMAALGAAPVEAKESGGPLYLTIDTGWMNYAEKMAEILQKRRIVGTCFVANEATFRGDKTLDDSWGDFWRGDVGVDKVRYVKWGNGESEDLDAAAVGRELHQPVERIKQLTGKDWLPLWRAPGGKTTARVIEMARQAGFRHQGWTDAGYLGDDLPSDKYPNQALLKRAMRDIKSGDVLLLHWGIHDRADKFINVLDDLLAGLQDKGFHFDHLPMKVT